MIQLTGYHNSFGVASQAVLEKPRQYAVSVWYKQIGWGFLPEDRTRASVKQFTTRQKALRGANQRAC